MSNDMLITVEGGVIQDITILKDCKVKVRVRDYDCDESPETDDRVIYDENGDECYEDVWSN